MIRRNSPNSPDVVGWTLENRIDVVFIMVSDILKKPILDAPRVGVINKHAALLPSCGGIYPYFWGRLHGIPTGVSFHEVDEGIDSGRVLVQLGYPSVGEENYSMLRFYFDVFNMYPDIAIIAIEKLLLGKFQINSNGLEKSYYSLPTRQDYINYRKKGFRICRLSDLFRKPFDLPTEKLNEIRGN
ncbi:MAG: hypothetical protein NUW37_12050 [Planctomycetes bacterium]|nr:hypothetical protein [Planctomycetota bacterium]